MKLTKQIKVEFLDGPFNVDISIERIKSNDGSLARWIINAVTETGYDLTNSSYGLIKFSTDANSRLKVSKSIEREANEVLTSIEEVLVSEAKRTINKRLIVTHELWNGNFQFLRRDSESVSIPFTTCAIKSKQSGNPIAWYDHDVYAWGTTLEIELIRSETGQLQAFADETKLYDFNKLQALADSERFKARQFAFFFYNEVERLLGRDFNGSTASMSGLFAGGEA